MSTYIKFDNSDDLQQISTIQGWGDVMRWAFDLPSHAGGFPTIAHLVGHGWEDDLSTLQSEFERALEKYTPPIDVLSTVRGIVEILKNRGDAEVLVITDGLTIPLEEDTEE